MIKYYFNPKEKRTIAVLNNCQFDAINKIDRMMCGFDWCLCSNKYMMPNQFKVSVKCSDDDEYNEDIGKEYAKAKLMEVYYRALDKRVEMFKDDLSVLTDRVFNIDRA